jgi:hypothetical protein
MPGSEFQTRHRNTLKIGAYYHKQDQLLKEIMDLCKNNKK